MRGNASRDNVNINGYRKLIAMGAKIFATNPFYAVSGDGGPNFLRDGNAEASVRMPAAGIDDDEMPAEQSFSIVGQLQVLGAFTYTILFLITPSQQFSFRSP